MIDKSNEYSAVIKQLNRLVKYFKIKLLLHTLIHLFPWLALFLVIGFHFKLTLSALLIITVVVILFVIFLKIRSKRYQQVTLENLLLHLNRIYPHLQESAQLVYQDENSLSLLQTLQKRKVIKQLSQLMADNELSLLPKLSYRNAMVSFIFAIVVFLAIYLIPTWLPKAHIEGSGYKNTVATKENKLGTSKTFNLTKSEITITPPKYTQLEVRQQNELNATVIQGSTIRWLLRFNNQNHKVFIEFSNGKRAFLQPQGKLSYSIEQHIDFTGIYRLGTFVDGVEKMLPKIYTITVTKDNKAKIRFISPKNTITEIATHSETLVSTHVQITDDFKVGKVEILASIAKGSGEAVKFRDEVFLFDTKKVIDGIENYYKNWQLKELKMEPGDELYFTVKAWDNRQPKAQMARSSTKIIRWLEDEEQAVLSDGILIDFMPEYFKSQRQIIIETIELISDKAELKADEFVETSELLGVAQSELKEKYGQYLGDEVEDGGGSHAISHEATENISHVASSENEHHHEKAGAHAEDDFEMARFGSDKSGGSDLISQFGHNHGDADIGMMARQDPKALMKRSIASMWQAELHLMLSQPSKALPFEQEALKYLKMAKKAERIYVKRLGFEPPPVSEKRRYQGELNDVLSYKRHQKIDLSTIEYRQLRDLYIWLNTLLSTPSTETSNQLTLTQRQLIVKVKKQFEDLLETRPALIKYVAIFERILLANTVEFKHCQTCLPDLAQKVWQILPEVTAKPVVAIKPYAEADLLSKKYAEFLLERQ